VTLRAVFGKQEVIEEEAAHLAAQVREKVAWVVRMLSLVSVQKSLRSLRFGHAVSLRHYSNTLKQPPSFNSPCE